MIYFLLSLNINCYVVNYAPFDLVKNNYVFISVIKIKAFLTDISIAASLIHTAGPKTKSPNISPNKTKKNMK